MRMAKMPKFLTRLMAVLTIPLLLSSCAELVQNLEQMQQEDKDSRTAQLMRIAHSTRQGGDLTSALALYLRASKLAPEELPPLIAIGKTAYQLGQFNQAEMAYKQANIIAPDDVEIHNGYGKTLIALGQAKLAQSHFLTITELSPTDSRGYSGLGVTLDLQGEHLKAQEQYRKGIAASPWTSSLFNNLALSLAISGNYSQALATLAPHQNDPRAGILLRQNLALIYGLAGQIENATAMASRDLDENSVANNLKYYQRLRSLSEAERAKALLGAK